MMVGSSGGNMQSAKQVLQKLSLSLFLPLSLHHIGHANNAVSSSFSNFKLIQTMGNRGLGEKRGREAKREGSIYERGGEYGRGKKTVNRKAA